MKAKRKTKPSAKRKNKSLTVSVQHRGAAILIPPSGHEVTVVTTRKLGHPSVGELLAVAIIKMLGAPGMTLTKAISSIDVNA